MCERVCVCVCERECVCACVKESVCVRVCSVMADHVRETASPFLLLRIVYYFTTANCVMCIYYVYRYTFYI